MKKVVLMMAALLMATMSWAQGVKPLPSLHVEGKWLVDTHGNHVVLHGVMDTPSNWFNGYFDENDHHHSYWSGGYDSNGAANCKAYFEKILTALEKAKCNVFRLHLDPAWTNDNSYVYSVAADQPEGTSGEADIKHFNPNRLKTYFSSVYWPIMQKAMNHRMYVVVRPPGVCPGSLKVGDYYQQYLLAVWDYVSQQSNIKKYSGQISIELANEPVSVKNAEGKDDPKALHDYFQPIVDKIRANGFTGIIWVPGTGWQSNYTSYATYPIEGYNIGYAVHDYDGWYGCEDKKLDESNVEQAAKNKIKQFHNQVPVVDTNPIIITEVDWSPTKPGSGHYNEHGNWVESNYGTWATGRTSMWGRCYKAVLDYYGNISMTLSGTACLIDINQLLKDGSVTPAFGGLEEACGKACMDWYADYYEVDWPHADFTNISISDQGTGTYKNPVVYADFPDPDVIRVGDTYYMVSTTMHHFPGATILKSTDLVNWEYCAQPLAQLSTSDKYSLINGQNAYAAGMWACSMKYHNGKFYLLINGNDAGGWLLTTTDPEGTWTKKKLSRIYYDPGMLFDNGKVYVACGITNINMCELDENFNFIREQNVISNREGLEGSHLYKIGDYYYIYATYGGWPSGQAVFRSKNIFGPYEEKEKMLLEKFINDKPNTIHQGALIDTPEGEWWTILQEDLGAFGRMPNLQPVKWQNDWPIIGNNGKPVAANGATYKKPLTSNPMQRMALPTNDNFRSYPLGMQWQWNHNPVEGDWSIIERQGWLRLRAGSITNELPQARNMLTQRIYAIHGKESKASTGTVRLDVSHLEAGDRAGICILQDPYAMLAVEKTSDGGYQLIWKQDKVSDAGKDFQPAEQKLAIQTDSIIYLRAAITKSTDKTQFYYSLDNNTFTKIGGETKMSFNLSVFVGARFGLFCHATQTPAPGGYADFDWFSTEDNFDEETFFDKNFEGFSEDMLTADRLTLENKDIEVMIGNSSQLQLTATYRDGHTANVASQARYSLSNPGIIEISGGRIIGLSEGKTQVTVTFTDPMGNVLTETFNVRSSYFPFSKENVKTNFFGEGTYNEKTHTFKPTQYGQMGWEYPNGVDFSGFKYLVVKLKSKSSDSHLNIFTENSIWGSCCATDAFGSKTQIVVNLQTAKYTSGDKKGQPLDTKNIHIVCFWGNGNQYILVDDIYLTNNDDYSPSGIDEVSSEPITDNRYYDLQGRQLSSPVRKGLYIRNGRKIFVK